MSKRLHRKINTELARADNYHDWKTLAIRKDLLDGMDIWKLKDRTTLYDYKAIRKRIELYRGFRDRGDDQGLLFALNEGIHGNMGGMGRSSLYKRAEFGTKQLISDYVDEVISSLVHLASDEVTSITPEQKLDFFKRASHCYGRTALMLSGSGSLFYFHLGVVKALWEQDLLPSVIGGASGGAIVSAIVGCHPRSELENIFNPDYLRMEVDKETRLNNFGMFNRFTRMSAGEVEKFFARLIPDLTFQEASELTGIHINVSVAPAEKHQTSRLLNDIASPNVTIREALLASSALPGFFPAVQLAAKDQDGNRKPYLEERRWIDGSVSDDLPIKRVMRLYGVNHTIVSQTNPVALPFLNEDAETDTFGMIKQTFRSTSKEWALLMAKLIDRPTKKLDRLSRFLSLTSSVLSQTYTGDINILPPRRIHNPAFLLKERTNAEILEMIAAGERSTWPYIERIRIQTSISRCLDQIIRNFESNLVRKSVPRLPKARSTS